MTANQNPKTTAASNTLKGSLRELGLFPKESNVATVKMKATEEPYFQRLLTGADENFRCTLTLPEKIVPTLGLAIGRVLDLEPVLAILTIHSGLALGDNSFEVPSADFRKQFLSCALYMLGIQQTGCAPQEFNDGIDPSFECSVFALCTGVSLVGTAA